MNALLLSFALAAAPPPTPALVQATAHGVDLVGLDRAVAPGDDFYAFANGGWAARTEIAADKSNASVWEQLDETARQHTVELIQAAAKRPDASGVEKQVADFYAAYMDEAAIEAKGSSPLTPVLAEVAALGDKKQLARALGQTVRADVDALNATEFHTPHFLGLWVVQALDDNTHYAPYLMQGGLLMPDRDYYLSTKPELVAARAKLEATLTHELTLAGQKDAAGIAKRALALELKLAKASASRLESEDLHLVQSWTREQLAKKAPGLDWAAFLDGASLSTQPRFFLWQPKAVTGLSALVGSESLKTWKDWLTAHAVAEHARLLSKAFVDADFEFRGKTLSGTPEQQPRWKRGVDATSDALGDAIGRLYVQKYFSAEAKARAKVMVDALVKAFAARVDRLSWLSEATRAKAKAKVATLTVGVGYPDTWVDYSGLTIDRADAFGNARRASAFEYQRQVAKLSKPVDRNEWWMTPQTVNAVNLPLQNALNFPAAILQPPFFDPEADPAANFGAMGTIIGHEISHSFDDSGAQFDAQGTFTNWWTDEDLAHFKAAGEQLAKQYDAYEPLPGLHLNGHQTLSENIADVAGLNTSWDAFVAQRPPAVTADGGAKNADAFTDEQRFFLSFAQVWRLKAREAAMRRLVITNGHAPGPYRALTVRNLDGWYQAFDVKPGQKLALPAEQRVRIW